MADPGRAGRGRVGVGLLVALVIAGCSAAAPTPQIIYVTPAPSVAGVLLSLSGNGERNSPTFTAPATYALDYAYDCTGALAARINITADRADGTYETLLNLGPAKASGTTYGHGAGPTYLEIGITCPWTVTVHEA